MGQVDGGSEPSAAAEWDDTEAAVLLVGDDRRTSVQWRQVVAYTYVRRSGAFSTSFIVFRRNLWPPKGGGGVSTKQRQAIRHHCLSQPNTTTSERRPARPLHCHACNPRPLARPPYDSRLAVNPTHRQPAAQHSMQHVKFRGEHRRLHRVTEGRATNQLLARKIATTSSRLIKIEPPGAFYWHVFINLTLFYIFPTILSTTTEY